MSGGGTVVDLVVAFNLGLASQVHCAGMCGGIVTALAVARPAPGASTVRRAAPFAVPLNLGRILSYAAAGALVGLAGHAASGRLAQGHVVLRLLASLVLIVTGLTLTGLLPRRALLEAAGAHVWRRIQPLGRRLMPIDSVPRALLFGALWGWLPCALVYSTLVFAAASGSPVRAALIMLAFGAGTLPVMVALPALANVAPGFMGGRGLRVVAGSMLVVAGVAYPFIGVLMHHGPAHPH